MELADLLLALGISTLYFGFAAGMGFIARRAWREEYHRWDRALAAAYGLLIFLPMTFFIQTYAAWSLALRIAVILAGIVTLSIAFYRPTWLPGLLWSRRVSRRYSALSMAIIFIWCLLAWRTQVNPGVLFLGFTACLAGLSSLRSSLQST
jgi:hypothetical protein